MSENKWLDEVAATLGVEPLGRTQVGEILKVSREVAHGVERMYAPLSSFLLGAAVQRAVDGGSPSEEAFAVAVARLRALLPEAAEGEG